VNGSANLIKAGLAKNASVEYLVYSMNKLLPLSASGWQQFAFWPTPLQAAGKEG